MGLKKKTQDKLIDRFLMGFGVGALILMCTMSIFVLVTPRDYMTTDLYQTNNNDYLGACQMMNFGGLDYGLPTEMSENGFEFLERPFTKIHANKLIRFNFTLENCILIDIIAYLRIWTRKSQNATISDYHIIIRGDAKTFVHLGPAYEGEILVDGRASVDTPFVLIVIVQPMAWYGLARVPQHAGQITIQVIDNA